MLYEQGDKAVEDSLAIDVSLLSNILRCVKY